MQYFFILGREKQLCSAEIFAKLRQLGLEFSVVAKESDFLILDFNETDLSFLMSQLAGTVKIGKIEAIVSQVEPDFLANLIPVRAGKTVFGISSYNYKTNLLNLGKTIKKILTDDGRSVRFVMAQGNELTSVQVDKNKLIEKGAELVLLGSSEKIFLGKTVAVQDFELYGELDFGRPRRDDLSGMLPPKLAQMMINLAEINTDAIIYDPFCGSGTILQQAIVLGYDNLLGSDNSPKAVQDSVLNLDWLEKLLNKQFARKVFLADATKITAKVEKKSVDAIITEPYLGPALRGSESPDRLESTVMDLKTLYFQALTNLQTYLTKKGKIVMIIPEFEIRKRKYQIPPEEILPDELKLIDKWRYAREGQLVARWVCLIEKR